MREAGRDGRSCRRLPGRTPEPRANLRSVTLTVAPGKHWLRRLADRPGVSSRLLACQPLPPGGTRSVHLLELAGPERGLWDAVSSVASSPSRTVATSSPARDRLLLRVIAPTGRSCQFLLRSGGICRTCRFRAPRGTDGQVRWEVLVDGPFQRLAGKGSGLRSAGTRETLHSLRTPLPYSRLTGRQEEALRCADRLGYFAVPRRASLGRVAEALGISRSSTAELLRRGMSVLLRSLDAPRPWEGAPSPG